MFHFNFRGKKYPESAAKAAREKGHETMNCVYAGPERMGTMNGMDGCLREMPERNEVITKVVYAPPEFWRNLEADGIKPKNQEKT